MASGLEICPKTRFRADFRVLGTFLGFWLDFWGLAGFLGLGHDFWVPEAVFWGPERVSGDAISEGLGTPFLADFLGSGDAIFWGPES